MASKESCVFWLVLKGIALSCQDADTWICGYADTKIQSYKDTQTHGSLGQTH